MPQSSKSYQERLSTANSKIGLAYASLVGVLSVSILLFFSGYFVGSDLRLWFAIVVAAVIGVGARLLKKDKPSKRWLACYYGLFHVLAFSFFFVVTPQQYFPPPYIVYWIMLSTVTYLDIGRRVFLGSVIGLGVAMFVKILVTPEILSSPERIGIIAVMYLFIAYTIFYVYLITTIAADEQKALVTTSSRIDYERRRLEAIINNMQEAVITCDGELNVTLFNKGASWLIDHTPEAPGLDGLKPNLGELLNLQDENNQAVQLKDLLPGFGKTANFTNMSHYFSKTHHSNLDIFVTGIQLGEAGGQVSNNYIIVLRDITRQKTLDDERNEFISIMSHELRTPVSVLEGGISLIRHFNKTGDKKKTGEMLDNVYAEISMLSELVNSMSLFLHNERHQEEVVRQDVSVKKLIDLAESSQGEAAKDKGLSFVVEATTAPDTIYSNEKFIVEIIQNFLTNAIKYTETGSVTLRVLQQPDNRTVFTVIDTGHGISKVDQAHVFEKFWRSENYKTRKVGGTGLGLYICARLAHSLDATVNVESTPGKGSSFSLSIPPKASA